MHFPLRVGNRAPRRQNHGRHSCVSQISIRLCARRYCPCSECKRIKPTLTAKARKNPHRWRKVSAHVLQPARPISVRYEMPCIPANREIRYAPACRHASASRMLGGSAMPAWKTRPTSPVTGVRKMKCLPSCSVWISCRRSSSLSSAPHSGFRRAAARLTACGAVHHRPPGAGRRRSAPRASHDEG